MKHRVAETQRTDGRGAASLRFCGEPLRVAAIILAAGESRRFGKPKLLLPWGQRTILQAVIQAALAAPVEPVALILGAYADEIEASLGAERARLQIVHNPLWATGQSSSLRAGLAALDPPPDATLFLQADQPNITPELLGQLIQTWRRSGALIVAPAYRGQRSSPALFDRALFAELTVVTGDQGGRPVIAKHLADLVTIEVAEASILKDIDTLEDYESSQKTETPSDASEI